MTSTPFLDYIKALRCQDFYRLYDKPLLGRTNRPEFVILQDSLSNSWPLYKDDNARNLLGRHINSISPCNNGEPRTWFLYEIRDNREIGKSEIGDLLLFWRGSNREQKPFGLVKPGNLTLDEFALSCGGMQPREDHRRMLNGYKWNAIPRVLKQFFE